MSIPSSGCVIGADSVSPTGLAETHDSVYWRPRRPFDFARSAACGTPAGDLFHASHQPRPSDRAARRVLRPVHHRAARQRPLAVAAWWPVFAAMPRMLKELAAQPELGYLGGDNWFGRTVIMVQYWRSLDALMAFASNNMHAVAETAIYLAQAERLMSADERAALIDVLAQSPTLGDIIPGTHGLRKLRVPLAGRGKRGGGRVIYYFHDETVPIYLLLA
jgi:hypothetical protein